MSSLADASVYGVVGVEILHIRSCLHRFYGRVSRYRYGKYVQTQRSYRLYTLLCGNLVSFVFAYSSLSCFMKNYLCYLACGSGCSLFVFVRCEARKALASAFLICGGYRVVLLGMATKCFVCT